MAAGKIYGWYDPDSQEGGRIGNAEELEAFVASFTDEPPPEVSRTIVFEMVNEREVVIQTTALLKPVKGGN